MAAATAAAGMAVATAVEARAEVKAVAGREVERAVEEREAAPVEATAVAAKAVGSAEVDSAEGSVVEGLGEDSEGAATGAATVVVGSADGYQRTRGTQSCRLFVLQRSTLHHCKNYSGTLSARPSSTPRRRTR